MISKGKLFELYEDLLDKVIEHEGEIAAIREIAEGGVERHNDTEGYFFIAVFTFFGAICAFLFYMYKNKGKL